jgi:hypothetical protein
MIIHGLGQQTLEQHNVRVKHGCYMKYDYDMFCILNSHQSRHSNRHYSDNVSNNLLKTHTFRSNYHKNNRCLKFKKRKNGNKMNRNAESSLQILPCLQTSVEISLVCTVIDTTLGRIACIVGFMIAI